ncbi:LysR family transcriptional regulator [Stutzerimonas stutzeri]|uniref:LysR family transcriptional regulator n=1 Tax=Stutzerimonas stutzeri TaxID=316 RepID=UPI000F78079C|nr:LysR family transcriptional regulator [Stutzerimonas stutzeri]RRV82455.1 LysR family transcriptional regulator [Stutzerimonas stutzeri]RRV90684.1 LysR family transcriptional regulator [Stutzerimonas stutzeri]RRV92345.1 LysR family transcriptional regulator [Stutzerimonas stutzeri]RRV96002.1 LysR family transcriptional regulator [Stutzerimonas stutzeri]
MLDAMTLDQIRTFVTVADSGSFRSGAARLLRVQSAVSHAIANLEAELELQLFDRSGYRPVLTPEGEALLAHARDILLRADAMRARARALCAGVELELALVVDTLFPIESVARAVAAASAEFPSTCFRMDVQALGGPIAALEDRRCALAIIVGEDFRNPRLSLEAIGSVQQVAVVCATHPLAAREERERLGIADLANHLQIVLTDPTPLSEGRSFGVLSPFTCRVNTQDAKLALIREGLGWGRLPTWQVQNDLDSGRLVRVPIPDLGRNSEVQSEAYLAHRLDEPLGPVAQAFRRALLEPVRG